MGKKYKVTNITIKPPKIDSKTGNDMRTALEKVGHPVGVRDGSERVTLWQRGHGSSTIMNELSEGTCRLARAQYIKVDEIDDVVTALKQHTLQPDDESYVPRRPTRRANAVEMGLDTHTSAKSGQEYDGAVNPDGEPNFLVKVKRGGGRKVKSVAEATAPASSTEEGVL